MLFVEAFRSAGSIACDYVGDRWCNANKGVTAKKSARRVLSMHASATQGGIKTRTETFISKTLYVGCATRGGEARRVHSIGARATQGGIRARMLGGFLAFENCVSEPFPKRFLKTCL